MELLLVFLAVIAMVVYVIYRSFSKRTINDSSNNKVLFNYRRKDIIMTLAERDFFKLLENVAGDRYFVFPQVHLSAIIDHKIPGQNWRAAFRHINEKSVDFVLCSKTDLKPMYAVELDDRSHDSNIRQKRDEEVERIFKAIDLPLIRFRGYKNLSIDDISQRFYDASQRIEGLS